MLIHCANCGAPLRGPWCHRCGQHSADLHRSVKRLFLEWLQGLVNFDNRIWTTLPYLIGRPARLTTNYLAGQRVAQIPPLRMFLVVLVIVFFTGSLGDRTSDGRQDSPRFKYVGETPQTGKGKPGVGAKSLTAAQKREIGVAITKVNVGVGSYHSKRGTLWLRERLNRVLADPTAYAAAFGKWAQRLAFLMLPVSTALLGVLFIRRRQIMLFDHMVFAMHSLSFQGLLVAMDGLLNVFPGDPGDWLLVVAPIHLFVHMRGVYPSSLAATLLRMTLLGMGSVVAFMLLLLGVASAGLMEMGAR